MHMSTRPLVCVQNIEEIYVIRALRGVDYTKYALATIIYQMRFSENVKTLSFCQKIFF